MKLRVISITHSGTDPTRSRAILNELILLLDKNIIIIEKKVVYKHGFLLNQRIDDFSKKNSLENVKERYLQIKISWF
jgi:siroheme synthase (precorrin-2 oxidase/ferrochelatase)